MHHRILEPPSYRDRLFVHQYALFSSGAVLLPGYAPNSIGNQVLEGLQATQRALPLRYAGPLL